MIESNLKHEIVDLLQTFYDVDNKSNVFLIDHKMLIHYISNLEVAVLIKQGYLPQNISKSNGKKLESLILGIFHEDITMDSIRVCFYYKNNIIEC